MKLYSLPASKSPPPNKKKLQDSFQLFFVFIYGISSGTYFHDVMQHVIRVLNFFGVDISDKKYHKCLNWSHQIQDTILYSKSGGKGML